jgi:hypothetical protein
MQKKEETMNKKSLLALILIVVAIFTLSLTSCKKKDKTESGSESISESTPQTLESIKNDLGVIVEGGGFKEGATLITNPINLETEDGKSVLDAISSQEYDKEA